MKVEKYDQNNSMQPRNFKHPEFFLATPMLISIVNVCNICLQKVRGAATNCCKCGGYCYVPCPSCRGSKKSSRRNTFAEDFCALRCTNCDDNGLVRCDICAYH